MSMDNRFKVNVIEAVEHSIRRDAIGHIVSDYVPEASELERIIEAAGYEVESHADARDYIEMWGTDEDGNTWRISCDHRPDELDAEGFPEEC